MSSQAASSGMQSAITSKKQQSPFGSFGILPKEIRELIYVPVFAAGSVALTRASKAFYEDTKRALYVHGVYRVPVTYTCELDDPQGDDRWPSWHWECPMRKTFPDHFIAKVQNLQVSISLAQYSDRCWSTIYGLGSNTGTSSRLMLTQLAQSLVSCRNFRIQLPEELLISPEEFRDLKISDKDFWSRLKIITVEWRAEVWMPYWRSDNQDLYNVRQTISSIERLLGFEKVSLIGDSRLILIRHLRKIPLSNSWWSKESNSLGIIGGS